MNKSVKYDGANKFHNFMKYENWNTNKILLWGK
jgi:hypothetical protein